VDLDEYDPDCHNRCSASVDCDLNDPKYAISNFNRYHDGDQLYSHDDLDKYQRGLHDRNRKSRRSGCRYIEPIGLPWLPISACCRSWAQSHRWQRLEDSESTISDGKCSVNLPSGRVRLGF